MQANIEESKMLLSKTLFGTTTTPFLNNVWYAK